MQNTTIKLFAFSFIFISINLFTSCTKDENKTDETTVPVTPGIRSKIDYSLLTPSTPYTKLFLNASGDTVVDLTAGNTRYKMFQALNYYLGAAIRDNIALDSMQMRNLFSNTGNPFTDVPSLTISGSDLNASPYQLRNITAAYQASLTASTLQHLEDLFGQMARLSTSRSDSAYAGNAGRIGNYLADAKGLEIAQLIQKGLIGAAQLDYIANTLLNTGLNANNTQLVSGKKYTQLEQNWDEAYGFLTLNPVYLAGSTPSVRGTSETFLGAYLWEYNKEHFANIYPAFLKGRAAIANNDLVQVKAQANFIRKEMERTIAAAAVGYLNKWKSGSTDAARIHAIGEGLGFIYSMRFCTLHQGNAAFSDDLIHDLVGSSGGYWDMTATKINLAIETINTKFNL